MVVGKVFVKWVLCKIRQNHVKAFREVKKGAILDFVVLAVPTRGRKGPEQGLDKASTRP